MKRLTVGTIVITGLIFTCVAFAVGASATTDLSIEMIMTMSLCLVGMMGVTFLATLWISTWLNAPITSKTRAMHQQKLLRHEINALRKELSHRERLIAQQETRIRQLQSNLSFASDLPSVGHIQRPESQPKRKTGTMTSPKVTTRQFRYGTPEDDLRRKRGTFPTIKPD